MPMCRGWVYLVVILDWFSRYVLAWEVSVTLDSAFCRSALERALALETPGFSTTTRGVSGVHQSPRGHQRAN